MTRLGNGAALWALGMALSATAWGQAVDRSAASPASSGQSSSGQSSSGQSSPGEGGQGQDRDKPGGLVIVPTELPPSYPHGPYMVKFEGRGNYVPVLHWQVQSGTLPPGITLSDDGVLQGGAERAGEFHFVVSVRDGDQPQQAVQREYTIKVVEAITLAWKVPAHVTANRIDGSVEVSNTTSEDMDLTFEVKAVAENGRATEIGYQHFPLKKGTIAMTVPFGETLPHGAYVVYVDVNGEIAKRNAIYKEEMKTPAALQVVVGP